MSNRLPYRHQLLAAAGLGLLFGAPPLAWGAATGAADTPLFIPLLLGLPLVLLAWLLLDQRRQLNKLRRKSASDEHSIQALLDTLPIPVFVKDEQSRYRLVNQALTELVGYSAEQMLGRTDAELYRPDEAERLRTTDLLALQEQQPISYETVLTGASGESSRIAVRKKAFRDTRGELLLTGVYHDVTSVHQTRERMHSLQTLLYNIIDAMPSLVIAIDVSEQVTQWNKRAEVISGRATALAVGKQLSKVFPYYADLEPLISRAFDTAQAQVGRKVCWQIEGQLHYVDIIVYPLTVDCIEGLVIRADNIDERVRMEEMMVFTEKMISVGSLAAGMAHEINNPLAVMIQNAQVLRSRLQEGNPKNEDAAAKCGISVKQIGRYLEERGVADMLDRILTSGARASRIVEEMVNFAQRRVACYSSCQLPQLVHQTLELARNDYDLKKKFGIRALDIQLDLPDDLPLVHCEMDQIQQVLLNLLRNSVQSLHDQPPQGVEPQILIRARAGDGLMRIEVIDNGPGIDPRIQQQIFEPFFTTRPVGTGTGLGLAASYFIITEKHGGTLRVDSKPGAGCRFIIELPLQGHPHGAPAERVTNPG